MSWCQTTVQTQLLLLYLFTPYTHMELELNNPIKMQPPKKNRRPHSSAPYDICLLHMVVVAAAHGVTL
jgi:hypothetical protein